MIIKLVKALYNALCYGSKYFQYLAIFCIMIGIGLITVLVFLFIKFIHRNKYKKAVSIITASLLGVVILIDTLVYYIPRNYDNVFDEIYWSMADYDFPGRTKISFVDTLDVYRDRSFLMVNSWLHKSVQDNEYTFCRADYTGINHSSGSRFSKYELWAVHSPRVLLFWHKEYSDWTLVAYSLNTRELSYCSSKGDDSERDDIFLDAVLDDWFSYGGVNSKFSMDNIGEYTNIGYKDVEDWTLYLFDSI